MEYFNLKHYVRVPHIKGQCGKYWVLVPAPLQTYFVTLDKFLDFSFLNYKVTTVFFLRTSWSCDDPVR